MQTTATLTAAPTVTLSNGLRLANFSSPHPFTFTDGSVLPACPPERCRALSAEVKETPEYGLGDVDGRWSDISLVTILSSVVLRELDALDLDPSIDLVIAPLMIVERSREIRNGPRWTKVRTIRNADRVAKIACIDRFCV